MTAKKERIAFIDVLKGCAIISVVLGHIVDGYYKSNLYVEYNEFFWAIFVMIYSFHMALFFVVSGYLYGMVYIKTKVDKDKIFRQVKRLLYVYAVWCVLMWGFKFVFGRWANSNVQLKDLFLIPIKAIEPYWYLYVLIVLYLFFSNAKIQRVGWKKIVFGLGVISLGISWMPTVHWFEITKLLYFSFFFYFGKCLSQKEIVLNKFVMIFGTAAVCIALLNYPKQIDQIGGINWLCAFGISITLFWIFQANDEIFKRSRILKQCGKYSLEIYVMHCFFTAFFRVMLFKINLLIIPINIGLNLLLSVITPILISVCMKKMKVYRLFFIGPQMKVEQSKRL